MPQSTSFARSAGDLTANPGSVSGWLRQAQSGDDEAIRKIWDRYFRRVLAVARQKLAGIRGVCDEEDVAVSTFDDVPRALRDAPLSPPHDRFEFWALLRLHARRRVTDQLKHERAAQRGGGRGDQQSKPNPHRIDLDLEQVEDHLQGPHLIAAMSEECQFLIDSLPDEELVAVVLWKLEGLTNEEIADQLGYTCRTVERMSRQIRDRWSRLRPSQVD